MADSVHPQATRVVIAAWLVVLAWCSLAFLILQFALAHFQALNGTWPFVASVTTALLVAVVALGLTYVALAVSIQCQSCGKRLFVEMRGEKRPRASRVWGMDHWASAIVNVLRQGQCTCMYCGSVRCAHEPRAI
jgi:hypothetical protein